MEKWDSASSLSGRDGDPRIDLPNQKSGKREPPIISVGSIADTVEPLIDVTGRVSSAGRITSLLEHHCDYIRDKMLAVARRRATPEQRQALAEAAARHAAGRRGETPR